MSSLSCPLCPPPPPMCSCWSQVSVRQQEEERWRDEDNTLSGSLTTSQRDGGGGGGGGERRLSEDRWEERGEGQKNRGRRSGGKEDRGGGAVNLSLQGRSKEWSEKLEIRDGATSWAVYKILHWPTPFWTQRRASILSRFLSCGPLKTLTDLRPPDQSLHLKCPSTAGTRGCVLNAS